MPYEPWIGPNYAAGAFFGQRLLIVGESHYGDDDPGLTQAAVLDACDGDHWQFFGQIGELFVGKAGYREDRTRFWNTVAFFNFVEESVGNAAESKPPRKVFKEMLTEAGESFLDRVAEIDPLPHRIIIFSSDAWSYCPDFSGEYHGHRYAREVKGTDIGIYGIYRGSGQDILTTFANHPGNWKFQKEYGAAFWRDTIWRFLTETP